MSYLTKSLVEGESVVYEAAIHWIIFVKPLLGLVLALAILVAAGQLGGAARFTALGAAAIVGVIGLYHFGVAVLYRWTTTLAVTTRKVVGKWGFIARQTIEQRLGTIDAVGVEQSVAGRLLNYGSVVVHGSGATTTPIKAISDPLRFRREVDQATNAYAGAR